MYNKNIQEKSFDTSTEQKVWEKGRVIPNFDANLWRWDACGFPIKRSECGNTNSEHGWEIDHIYPVSKGGSDTLSNLQPLQWDNNRRKGDLYPWSC